MSENEGGGDQERGSLLLLLVGQRYRYLNLSEMMLMNQGSEDQFTIVIQWDRPQQEHRERAQDRKSPQLSAHPTFWGCEGLWRWFGGQLRWFIIIGDKQSRVWPKKGKNFVLQRGMMGELYKPGIMKNKSKNIELTTLRMQIMLTKLATFGPFSTGGNVETLHKCQIVKYPWKNSLNVFPFSANNIFP